MTECLIYIHGRIFLFKTDIWRMSIETGLIKSCLSNLIWNSCCNYSTYLIHTHDGDNIYIYIYRQVLFLRNFLLRNFPLMKLEIYTTFCNNFQFKTIWHWYIIYLFTSKSIQKGWKTYWIKNISKLNVHTRQLNLKKIKMNTL